MIAAKLLRTTGLGAVLAVALLTSGATAGGAASTGNPRDGGTDDPLAVTATSSCAFGPAINMPLTGVAANREVQIGRASCRERV